MLSLSVVLPVALMCACGSKKHKKSDVPAATATAPAAPSGIVALSGRRHVTLKWLGVAGAKSYDVLRAVASLGPFASIGSALTTEYADTDLTDGVTYFYRVIATNEVGPSPPSSIASATPRTELCLLEETGSIDVFSALADGDVKPLRRLGNLTYLANPGAVSFDESHSELLTLDSIPYSIATFGIDDNGCTSPKRRFLLGASYYHFTIAPGHDEIIVAGTNIDTFGRLTDGEAAPLRSLPRSQFGDTTPRGLAYDADADELLVLTQVAVYVFDRTAAGGAAMPKRTITGAATGLTNAMAIAVSAGEAYVLASDGIRVFAADADGNVAPIRTASGAGMGLDGPKDIAIDDVNDEIFVANANSRTVTVYTRSSSGTSVTPLRTLTADGLDQVVGLGLSSSSLALVDRGNAAIVSYPRDAQGSAAAVGELSAQQCGASWAYGSAVDASRGELYVANYALSGGTASSISVYDMGAKDTPALLRRIMGPATELNGAADVAFDAATDEIYVTNYDGDTLTVYDRSADGDVAPKRSYSGPASGLSNPEHLFLDLDNQEIFVANYGNGQITVYDMAASGSAVTAKRTIGAIQLGGVTGILVDAANNEVIVSNRSPDWVLAFDRVTDSATATPSRIIPQEAGFNRPWGILLDQDELFVANLGGPSLNVYDRTADSSTTVPKRSVAGTSTGVVSPTSIEICNN